MDVPARRATCHGCQREFSALRLGMQWPGKVTCAKCGVAHAFRHGHAIGAAYIGVLLPISVGISILSSSIAEPFETIHNGIRTSSVEALVVYWCCVALLANAVMFTGGALMRRFLVLRPRTP